MKTHFLRSPQLPLASHTCAAIYIMRHPADVMLSNFHYSKRTGAKSDDDGVAFDRYVDSYIEAGGDPRWIRMGMGTWAESARSWIGQSAPFPVLRLRYEDLLADAAGIARTLCRFLGLERTPDECARAADGASFERLRQIEQSDIDAGRIGIFYKPYLRPSIGAGLRFMRGGRAGEAERALSSEQHRRFTAAFGAAMQEFGYLPSDPQRASRA